jgi:dipeptidyl aminopeptidase/acylaminoacyl peptidase
MKRLERFLLCFVLLSTVLLAGCTTPNKTISTGIVDIKAMVPNGDHDIPVVITMPIGVGDVPAVVMMHGTGSDKDEAGKAFLHLAPMMAEAGMAAVRFDFPGNGESTASYELYSNTTAVSDAEAVAVFVAGLSGIDGDRIGVMGWSQGGTDALLAAGMSDTFSSVLTWSAALHLEDMATPKMRQEAEKWGYTMLTFDWRTPLKLGKQWIDEAIDMDVLSYVENIVVPIGSIHGTADETVPYSDSVQVQEAATDGRSTLMPIEGADHLYGVFSDDPRLFELLAKKTIDWFVATL